MENIELENINKNREYREKLAEEELNPSKFETSNIPDTEKYKYVREEQTPETRVKMLEYAVSIRSKNVLSTKLAELKESNTIPQKYENYGKLYPDDEYQPGIENLIKSRHRGWLIKSKNVINIDELKTGIKYLIYNIEEEPDTKEIIFNGYIEYTSQRTFSAVEKDFPQSYLSGRYVPKKLIYHLILKEDFTVSGPVLHEVDLVNKLEVSRKRLKISNALLIWKRKMETELKDILNEYHTNQDIESVILRIDCLKNLIHDETMEVTESNEYLTEEDER